jgi:phage terminase Nu1 subunit (DNA packaging protein)
MVKIARLAGQILNREELAGLLGVSTTQVDAYIRAGCPVVEKGAGRRPYKFNSADVIAWRDKRAAEVRDASGEGNADASKRRHMAAAAELKELQLAEKRGSMIHVEDVAPLIADELANVRSRLMAMPGRLSSALVGLDQPAIEQKIRDEVSGALSELTQ